MPQAGYWHWCVGFTTWTKANCRKFLASSELRIHTLVEPSNQRERLDLFFLPMASSWDEGCASNVTDAQPLIGVDACTGNEMLLRVERIASSSESVSFLLPVFAFPRVQNQSMFYCDDCSWNLGSVEVNLAYDCLTIVLRRFTFLPSQQEQSPFVSCFARMWFGHTSFKFVGLF